jgi:hypothetical protein
MMRKKAVLTVALLLEHVGKIFLTVGLAQFVAHRKVFLSWKNNYFHTLLSFTEFNLKN